MSSSKATTLGKNHHTPSSPSSKATTLGKNTIHLHKGAQNPEAQNPKSVLAGLKPQGLMEVQKHRHLRQPKSHRPEI